MKATDPQLRMTLNLDEGRRTRMYRCSAGKHTVGIGHNLDDRPIPEAAIDVIYLADVETCIGEAATLPGWGRLSAARRRVVVEMVFQMGLRSVRGFPRFLAALERRDYDAAADEMMDSKWAKQDTPERAGRAAQRMRDDTDDDR